MDGSGSIDEADERILADAAHVRRGWEVEPADGYDPRADLLARGRVDSRDLRVWRALRDRGAEREIVRRPITVAWHYGWHHRKKRTRQTCQFLGGDYLSRDPVTEGTFNDLKNEFGITVDGLAWISPRKDGRMLANYRRGYLQAAGLPSRHTALLYESRINLPRDQERIDFASLDVRGRLVEDFGLMGEWFRRLEDRGGRPFLLDSRPVVFLYASHAYVTDTSSKFQFRALADAFEEAMNRFMGTYGIPPYVVGEELPLAPGDEFSGDRQMRCQSFDAAFVYHHAAHPTNIIHGGHKLGAPYARRQQQLLQAALPTLRSITNRITGREVMLIPSLASGFAKNGYRKLWVTRRSYANYLRDMHAWLDQKYYSQEEFRTSPLRAPVYTVGSWNEEFEGHSLFPFSYNRSVRRPRNGGFDLALALKEAFGWNIYAQRELP